MVLLRAIGNLKAAYRLQGFKGLLDALADYWRWRTRALRRGSEPQTAPSRSEWLGAFQQLRPEAPIATVRFSVIIDGDGGSRADLGATIRSLVAQTHTEWKVTVITSTPPERSVLSDERVRFRAPNPTYCEAVNAIFRDASAEHLILLRSGDSLRPNGLEWLSSVALESDVVYCDGGADDNPNSLFWKPGWSPRLLLTSSYLDGPLSLNPAAFFKAGGFLGDEALGAGLDDLLLRLSVFDSLRVTHLPIVLQSHWSVSEERVDSGHVSEALRRRGWEQVEVCPSNTGRPSIKFTGLAKSQGVKVVIPTRDRSEDLEKAVNSVIRAVGVTLTELVVIDNGSSEQRTLDYLESITIDYQAKVIRVDEPFNFSKLCNIGARSGTGSPYLLFLNNDVEARDPRWLMQLAGWLDNDEGIAAVTPQLRYPDGRVQYGGTVVGMGGIAGHYAVGSDPHSPGLHQFAREVAAVTAACLLVRAEDFQSVGGFAEELPTDFQDVDFSLKLRDRGRVLMYDPTHPLVHFEGATRGRGHADPATLRAFIGRWEDALREGDPFYSPHLADARWDPVRDGWVHDPNELRLLPTTPAEALERVRPRRVDHESGIR